jgi:hypothetical protein
VAISADEAEIIETSLFVVPNGVKPLIGLMSTVGKNDASNELSY